MNEKQVEEQAKKIIGKGRRALRLGVNIFVYTFVGIFMLLMVFFGISQTSLFKDWLRDSVVQIANDELNGKLSIGELNGTIFTSLILNNVTLTDLKKDTIITAGKIELRTSPLKILFKNIYVRKFELADAKIKLIEEADGKLNLLKIFPPSTEPEDTTSSEFPFSIEVADFALNNIDFSMQKFDKVGSTAIYKSMNMDDLRINNLNLSLNAFADLNKYTYRLTINNFSFDSNFEFFKLKNLTGSILLNRQLAGINKLHLITEDSDVELSAAISGVDFIENFSSDALAKAPIRLSFKADKLSFDDVTTYVPPMEMLIGAINADLEASGTLSELDFKRMFISYNNTQLNGKATLKNLLDIDNMYFDVSLNNSFLDPSDPNKMLRNIELPEYKEFGVIKFDTLSYSGGPFNFNTTFALSTNKGILNGTAKLDLRPADMIYDLKLNTRNLDLSSFLPVPATFNSEISIKGVGTDPNKMNVAVNVNAGATKFGDVLFNNVNLSTESVNGLLTAKVNINSDSMDVHLESHLNMNNANDPVYDVNGKVNGLNLARLLNNDALSSDINFEVIANGQGFNPDSMNLDLTANVKNSSFTDLKLNDTKVQLNINRNDKGKKSINFISDIVDFYMKGDYKLTSLGNVMARESEILNKNIADKMESIYPDSLPQNLKPVTKIENKNDEFDDFNIDYKMKFKQALNLNFGGNQIEIDGKANGKISSLSNDFSADLNADFNYIKFLMKDAVYFLINSGFDFDISNKLQTENYQDVKSEITFKSDRIYTNGNLYDVVSSVKMNENRVNLTFNGKYEDNINTSLGSYLNFNPGELRINIYDFLVSYNQLKITNENNLVLGYSNNSISFKEFLLKIADGSLKIDGSFGREGEHEINVSLENLTGRRLVRDIIGAIGQREFQSDISLHGKVTGNFAQPKFAITTAVENISYGSSNFGSLLSDFDYADNSLHTDIKFLDSLKNYIDPNLSITGFIPLNLTVSSDTSVQKNKNIELAIESDDYDLSAFSDIFPFIQFNKGRLETDIYVSGTLTEPVAVGYFSINDAAIKSKNNNLEYNFDTKVWIDDEDITIEKIELKNVFGTLQGGVLTGDGFIKLNEFKLDSIYFKVNGDLKVLDKISKSTSPFIYGNLAFRTRGDILYVGNREKSLLNFPIDITVADLVVPLQSSAYSSSSGFIYKYIDHSTQIDKLNSELDSLIQNMNQRNTERRTANGESKFNYSMDLKLKTEAEVVVNLSKELDQNLVAVLGGGLMYEMIDGKKKSSGELKLLDGSKLSFIKSFEASGNVKLEKIDNPIVDITGTYKDFYYPADSKGGSTEQEVAVKIKLRGPLSELNSNFIKDENNIGVYMGRQNIEEDKKDASKTASDAMFFIITGKFTEGATQQDKNTVASTATSLAGSVLGGFLNQYLGDYVKSVQLRQTGTETKFSLIGKAWGFKYEIGGSTDVFQDLSRANIKIEYPITQRLQLRLQRKESEAQSSSINNPLFNEFGVKYNIEF